MNKIFRILCFIAYSITLITAYTGEVINSFDLPTSCPTGLTYDGNHIWFADRKADQLFCLDTKTGAVIRSLTTPAYWPMGLAWDGKYLWNADLQTRKLYQIDPQNGNIIKTLDYPAGSPRGLAWDGEYIWAADNRNDEIIQISPTDGTTIRSFKAPAKDSRGLCFDGQYLWNADRLKDEIYMVDPLTGDVIIITHAPAPFARGMAYDGQFIWIVDYQTDQLYQLSHRDEDKLYQENPRTATISLTHQTKNFGPGNILSLDIHFALPTDRDNQTIQEAITFSPQPDNFVTDQWGQKSAHFHYDKIVPLKRVNNVMQVKATTHDIRYFIYPDATGSLADIPQKIQQTYLQNNEKYQLEHPYIVTALQQAVGAETNPYWIARKIFDYLIDNMYYELSGGWNTAPTVLKRGNGSCSEYTFVYIAMCRAAGLPARYVGSLVVRGDEASLDDVFHRWVEVYFPHYGWIPVDPSGGDNELPRDQARYFGALSNRFLITTQSGGGSETLGWTYNANQFWKTDPQTKVYTETIAEWEPLRAESEKK